MIESLSIRNVALIERLDVSFGAGLNILTGETGAGKSIIIDAVNFALGGKAGRDFIRGGAEAAEVRLFLNVNESAAALAELGVFVEEDGTLLLSRTVNGAGKGACRVNGKPVTLGMLKEAGALLVDIHGQHEHQSLLNPARHIDLLDRFCGGDLPGLLARLAAAHKAHRDNARRLKALQMDADERQYRVDMLTYQIGELEAAHLIAGEDDELNRRKRQLAVAEKLAGRARKCAELLCDGGDDESAADKLSGALELLRELAAADERLADITEQVESAYAQLDDAARGFRKYAAGLRYDPREIDEIESRLDALYSLRRKYGATSADMLGFLDNAKEKLAAISGGEEQAGELLAENERLAREMDGLCAGITKLRAIAAARIRAEIEKSLKDLGMKDAVFQIGITPLNEPTANGRDAVEFLISANKGEPPKPLAKIASGGEMSRVMLAMKATLADCDSIETFIFDEIDAGVSGRTASRVAEKLAYVAEKRQVLCITHLPQIAAAGRDNYLIEKAVCGGRAETSVTRLDEGGVLAELARLIGGEHATEAAYAAARELRQAAGRCG